MSAVVISAQDVNRLRQLTGAGMMDCKKALSEANGDFEAAVDILRKRGQKVSSKRADRETTEGVVFVDTYANDSKGVIFALGCETDFVARNEEFVAIGKALLAAAVANNATSSEALLALQHQGRSFAENITDLIGKIGEKIEVVNFSFVEGEKLAYYVHSNLKVGVLVSLANVGSADYNAAGKDVGMQIAAMNPVAVDKDDVDATILERELEIGKAKAREEGKPENIVDKIAQGFVQKFYKDSTLLNQQFVKDAKLSVREYLNSLNKGMTVTVFKRVSLVAE